MKKCGKCGEEKPLSAFHKDKSRNDGYMPYCKKCRSCGLQKNIPDGYKKCSSCKSVKLLENFGINRANKDGLQGQCKECLTPKKQKYANEHKEQNREYKKRWHIDHSNYWENYYSKEENKFRHREQSKASYYKYSKKRIKCNTERDKERLKEDIKYRLCKKLRTRINMAVSSNQKSGSAVNDLGCSIQELKQRLELMFYPHPKTGEQMTWDNYGLYGWHLDHIMPLSLFDLTDREQFLRACHYSNLQPLWAKENIIKGNRIK